MSTSVQATHSSHHTHPHHSHHNHNHIQYQEFNKMTPGPRSENRQMKIHPLLLPPQPPATSRQVSRDSSGITFSHDDYDGAYRDNPKEQGIIVQEKDFDEKEQSSSSRASPDISTAAAADVTTSADTACNQVKSSSISKKIVTVVTPQETNQHTESRDHNQFTAVITASNNTASPSTYTSLSANSTSISTNISTPAKIPATTTTTTHTIGDRSAPFARSSSNGTKRKMSPNATSSSSIDESVLPTARASQSTTTTMSRRDSLPMGLRNKKMKPTDCLLFAATLLEQDAAEALVAAASTLRSTNNIRSYLNSEPRITKHTTTPFVTSLANICSSTTSSSPTTTAKVTKKLVCETLEKSLQEVTQQQQQQVGDIANKPKDADVLCGRGGKVNKHPGNIVYRKVVEYNKSYYQSVHKKHRILVSQSIVKAILNYGGRFMGQKGKEWTAIGFKRAVQKTSQALRERSNSSDVLQGAVGEFNGKLVEVEVKK